MHYKRWYAPLAFKVTTCLWGPPVRGLPRRGWFAIWAPGPQTGSLLGGSLGVLDDEQGHAAGELVAEAPRLGRAAAMTGESAKNASRHTYPLPRAVVR